jgi:hypothetical protein
MDLFPLTPALSPRGRGEREQISMLFKLEFDWILQVDVDQTNNSVSPLCPRRREGKGADLQAFQT